MNILLECASLLTYIVSAKKFMSANKDMFQSFQIVIARYL